MVWRDKNTVPEERFEMVYICMWEGIYLKLLLLEM
jgi:hypothetical protein